VLGAGTITLFPIASMGFDGVVEVPGLNRYPVRVIGLAAGALLLMGYLKALFGSLEARAKERRSRTEARARDAANGAGGAGEDARGPGRMSGPGASEDARHGSIA
jgi:hypothetical protein